MAFTVKITLKSFNCKGFLIIEIIIALGLLATLMLVISHYQLQVQLYKKAASQIYVATSKCEDLIEKILAGQDDMLKNRVIIDEEFQINLEALPGPNLTFKYVEITAVWINAFNKQQKIKFDLICL